jgi:hypothetical protein
MSKVSFNPPFTGAVLCMSLLKKFFLEKRVPLLAAVGSHPCSSNQLVLLNPAGEVQQPPVA